MRRRRLATGAALAAAVSALAAMALGTGASDAAWSQQVTLAMPTVTIDLAPPTSSPDPNEPVTPGTPPSTGKAVCHHDSTHNVGIDWYGLKDITPLSATNDVFLVAPGLELALPSQHPSGDSVHFSLSDRELADVGWIASTTPQTVYIVLRDRGGVDIDSVAVTLSAEDGMPTIIACPA